MVKKIGSSGTTDGKFDSPVGLALDTSNDLLYVADTDNNRIQVFKLVDSNTCTTGTKIIDGVCLVEKFGSSGSTDGKFDSPSGLALYPSNNLLYVADTDNNRIQVFSTSSGSTQWFFIYYTNSPKNLKGFPSFSNFNYSYMG